MSNAAGDESGILFYLSEQVRLGRADFLPNGYLFIVSAQDAELFSELRDCYAISFPADVSEYSLIRTEDAYDEAVLAALAFPSEDNYPGELVH